MIRSQISTIFIGFFLLSVTSFASLATETFLDPSDDLCQATMREDVRSIKLLLDRGADPTTHCMGGSSAIEFATIFRDKTMLSTLLAGVKSNTNINWNELLERTYDYDDRHFYQYILNEKARIEAAHGLADSTVIPMCGLEEKGGFIELILCDGHAFIHTNVSIFGAPAVKHYDNSTGRLVEHEQEADEYIGFYPQAVHEQRPRNAWEAFSRDIKNIPRSRQVSLISEYGTSFAKSYYFPSRKSSSRMSVQGLALAPIRITLFGINGQSELSKADLVDEREFYSQEMLDTCQKSFIELNANQLNSLSRYLHDAKKEIENGETQYQLFGSNCVDFVQRSLQSTGVNLDLPQAFQKSDPLDIWRSGSFSITSAWAHYQADGLLPFIRKLLKL